MERYHHKFFTIEINDTNGYNQKVIDAATTYPAISIKPIVPGILEADLDWPT
jgi:hypothetical protein